MCITYTHHKHDPSPTHTPHYTYTGHTRMHICTHGIYYVTPPFPLLYCRKSLNSSSRSGWTPTLPPPTHLLSLVLQKELELFLSQRLEFDSQVGQKGGYSLRFLGHAHVQHEGCVCGEPQEMGILRKRWAERMTLKTSVRDGQWEWCLKPVLVRDGRWEWCLKPMLVRDGQREWHLKLELVTDEQR